MGKITVNANDLFAAARRFRGAQARDKDLVGYEAVGPLDALAISPKSDVREVWCYFDNDPEPELLQPGRIVVRSAQRVAFAPVMPCTFAVDKIGLDFTPSPLLAPAVLRVDAWQGQVPLTQPVARTSSIDRGRLLYTPQSTDPELCAIIQVAGARVLRVWGSNDHNANTAAATLEVRAMRSQVDASEDPRSDVGAPEPLPAAGAVLATLTIPATADDGWRVEAVIVDPGCREIGFFLTPGNNDPVTFAAGVEIEWC